MDSNGDTLGKAIIGYVCHGQGGNQYWMLSKNHEIRRDEHCFDYSGGKSGLGQKEKILTYTCHNQGKETHRFQYDKIKLNNIN